MRSPFPGMDPYLEDHWGDVHSSLVIYARDQLRTRLPSDLRARVEERVFVESPEGRERSILPDVRVFESAKSTRSAATMLGDVAVAEPTVIEFNEEPITQTYVEIIDWTSGGRVVTAIEFLSKSTKTPGDGRNLYLRKQQQLRDGRASSVEIDLVRAGARTFAITEPWLPESHRTGYAASARRARDPVVFELYSFSPRERLPAIRIPLRESDNDVPLDLQALIGKCYENGGYDTIDYGIDPRVPLADDDAHWANALLRDRGLR